MKEERITEGSSWSDPQGQVMKTPDDVAEMLRLRACGWGLKRIARQLGCSHHTLKDYVAAGGGERFIRHRGNADVVWCGRTCWPRKAWQSAGERCNAPCSPIAKQIRDLAAS